MGAPGQAGSAIDERGVTEIRSNHRELQRQREALLRSKRLVMIGELFSGVAHELNNPLSVILGQSSLLAETVKDGPIAERARLIADAAERAARIVHNFLAVVQDRRVERVNVSLNHVVREAAQLLAYQFRMASVNVVFDLADSLPPVWGDPHQLYQVVVNLLMNAHQAVRVAPRPRRIRLSTAVDPVADRVVLDVADTGAGVPETIRSRIFELGAGTGLGLSLCRDIIGAHHGAIRLVDSPGPGTTFRVELLVGGRPSGEGSEGTSDVTAS